MGAKNTTMEMEGLEDSVEESNKKPDSVEESCKKTDFVGESSKKTDFVEESSKKTDFVGESSKKTDSVGESCKKAILLRSLEDSLLEACISERFLEVLEELEKELLCLESAAMRAAYSSIAVECTLKYLEIGKSNPKYVEAVERIWKGRVQNMQNGGTSFLLSDDLKQWKTDIENSLLDETLMEKLASMPNTRRDAIRKLQAFLAENQSEKVSLEGKGESLPTKEVPKNVPDPEACHNEPKLNETTPCSPSLMKPHECDDSLDGLQEKASYQTFKFSLPSPRRVKVSPLKPYEPKKITKRRRIKKWSKLEVENLKIGVNRFGKGHWKLILDAYEFEERTQVDLKDKWRNMTRKPGQ